MSEDNLQGGCQCGAVRYRVSGEPMMAALCHCTMCRRASAAPAVAWALYGEDQVELDRSKLKHYASSEEAQRAFCPECGTQIAFTASFLPGLVDITIGSLDEPARLEPSFHYWHAEHLAWAEFADQLPRHAGFPPME